VKFHRIALRVLTTFFLLLSFALAALWVVSFTQAKSPAHGSAGFRLMRLDEGDCYLFLVPGAVEQWMYTPWDAKWYFSASHSLWVGSLVSLVLAGIVKLISKIPPLPRRVSNWKCAQCGYDLRATPDRCPECGQIPRVHA